MADAKSTATAAPAVADSKKASSGSGEYFAQWKAEEINELGSAMAGYVRRIGMGKVSCPFKVEYNDKRKWTGISGTFTSPTAQLVFENGVPTVKYDGMNCLKVIHDGKHVLLIRYDQKLSKEAKTKMGKKKLVVDVKDPACVSKHFKAAPPFFVPTESAPDPVTFHYPGYVPIFTPNTENAYQFEEYLKHEFAAFKALAPHTYELVGPDVNGNVHQFTTRRLLLHGATVHDAVLALPDRGRTLASVLKWFQSNPPAITSEGIVWHYKPPAKPAASTTAGTAAGDNKSAAAPAADEEEVLMVKLTRAHCGLLDWANQKANKAGGGDGESEKKSKPAAKPKAAAAATAPAPAADATAAAPAK